MVDNLPASTDRNGVQVIARAAAILRTLEAHPSGLSLGEIAKHLGLARSTVQRLVGALADEHLLMSAGPRSGVTLGPALVRLAAAANVETESIARPSLQALSRELAETVDLSTLRGRNAMFVDQVLGASRLIAVSAVGEAFPLHCTANGKALLGVMRRDRARALIADSLTRHPLDTGIDAAMLEREVEEVRDRHLAFDIEEHSDGICAVGTAFIDTLGREFAISVPVPTARFAAKRDEISARLIEARDEVVRAIPGAHLGALNDLGEQG